MLHRLSRPSPSVVVPPHPSSVSVPALPRDVSSLEALRTAVDAMDEYVTLLTPDGRLLHVNRSRRASAIDASLEDPALDLDPLGSAEHGDAQSRAIAAGVRSVLGGERETFEVEYSRATGATLRWFALRASAIGVDGVGAVVVQTDVTTRRQAERALEHRSDHDGLTGLGNRRLLEQRLEELLVAGPVGVIALRLHGSDPRLPVRITAVGEDALRETATLVEQLVDEQAVTGRHGADHFVVLLPGADHDDLRRAAMPLAAGWHARLRRRDDLAASIETLVVRPGDDARDALDRATRGESVGAGHAATAGR